MRLAVCLISADRYEYTRTTVESFAHHHPQHDFIMLQADDASEDPRIRELGRQHGYTLVSTPSVRSGGQAMRRLAIQEAKRRGATHVMILENDIETVRPLPMPFLRHVFDSLYSVYCVRLYGTHKERNKQRACAKVHLGKKTDPGWQDYYYAGEHAQIGDIHWGAQPCVTSIKPAVWLHEGTTSEAHIRRKCAQVDWKTVRLMDNVCYHIGGRDRTPNFKA